MLHTARRWPALTGVLTAALAAAVTFGPVAAADPAPAPPSPQPAPLTPDALARHNPAAGPVTAPRPQIATPAAPAGPTTQPLVPATSDTLREYLQDQGVELEPQQAAGFDALDITLPVPTGWTRVPDPNVPDAFVVIANRNSNSLYTSNAALVVYRLVGDFDAREAITHANIETQQQSAWRTTDQAIADYNGQPTARIEGTFRQNDMTLNTSRRTIIADSSTDAADGADRYLVSLAVTNAANLAVSDATATEAILTGFSVRPPAAATPGRAPNAPPAPNAPAAPASPAPTAAAPAAPGPAAPVPTPRR
ncbi:MAG TPA: LpqN/LpqT family lipoprotein [Mycolicibacillus parakoreensis]|nr:LpqN/LpqT family lipoprotein [Mycolicibacillus parakoreensis]